MAKKINVNEKAEISAVAVKNKKNGKNKGTVSKKLWFWVAVSLVFVIVSICVALHFSGVFDELDRIIHNKDKTEEIDYSEGFVNYTFNVTNMPVGYYAKFIVECEEVEYDFTAFLFSSYAKETVSAFVAYAKIGHYTNVVIDGGEYKEIEGVKTGYVTMGTYKENQKGELVATLPQNYQGSIVGEFKNNGHVDNKLSHTAGVLTMVRGEKYDSATTQFKILAYDNLELNGDYCAFGKITTTKGLENLRELTEKVAQGKKAMIKSVNITISSK